MKRLSYLSFFAGLVKNRKRGKERKRREERGLRKENYWRVPPIRDDPLARNRRFYFFGDFSFLLVGMFHMAGYCGIGLRVCHIFLKFFVKTGKIGQKSYRLIKKLCFTRGMMVKIRGENCVSYKWVYPLVRNRRCQLT